MTKHTPGPWCVFYGHETGYPLGIYAPGDANKAGAVGSVVRSRGIGLPSSPVGLANAHLIAAAPDLLAAARAVRETCPADPDINPEWNAAWDSLVAAIAKAEGKS